MPILAGSSTAGTTLADLVAETQRHLTSYQRPSMNKLDAAISATATDLAFTFESQQLQQGHYIEVGLELMYVWSVESASRTAVVERAQQGSRAVAHAAGSVVKINPKFPDFAIAKAINDDLRALSSPMSGLYAVRSLPAVTTYSGTTYDLTDAENLMEIIEVQDTQVLYKSSFAPMLLLADDVEAVSGLPASAHDLPPLGAAIRLGMSREIRRNFFEEQGDSRRSEEVGAGAVTSSVRGLMVVRQARITEEASRLAQLYPERHVMPSPIVGLW